VKNGTHKHIDMEVEKREIWELFWVSFHFFLSLLIAHKETFSFIYSVWIGICVYILESVKRIIKTEAIDVALLHLSYNQNSFPFRMQIRILFLSLFSLSS
jgi:hypothetical protein